MCTRTSVTIDTASKFFQMHLYYRKTDHLKIGRIDINMVADQRDELCFILRNLRTNKIIPERGD